MTWLHWQGLPKMQGLHISIPLGRDLSVMCGGINPVMFDVYGHIYCQSLYIGLKMLAQKVSSL